MPFNDLFVLDLKNELKEQSYIFDNGGSLTEDLSVDIVTRNQSLDKF